MDFFAAARRHHFYCQHASSPTSGNKNAARWRH
nr:MAG TPA: hypothetical protein [Caudoviricetes sp.]